MRRQAQLVITLVIPALAALVFGSIDVAATTVANGPFALAATALLGKDGVSDVYAATSTTTTTTDALPTIFKHVQLKSYDSAGVLQYARNFQDVPAPSGTADITRSDLQRGQPLQVGVEAQTAQTTSTEVLTAETVVKFRPELSLESLQSPSQVFVNAHFNVSALVKELKGDTGATGTVQVLDGATVLDTVQSVAVPAGGAKGVAFSLSFGQVGTYNLSMQISNVVPGEWDTLHNTVNFTVVVVPPNKPLAYQSGYFYNDWTINCDPCGYQGYSSHADEQFEGFWVAYTTQDQVTPAGTFRLKIASEAGTVQDLTISGIQLSSVGALHAYYSAYLADVNGVVEIIASPYGTYVYFSRSAGDYTYSYNYANVWGSGNFAWGHFMRATQSLSVFADLPDVNGTHYGGTYEMSLTPYGYSYDYDWWFNWSSYQYHLYGTFHGYYGFASGQTVW